MLVNFTVPSLDLALSTSRLVFSHSQIHYNELTYFSAVSAEITLQFDDFVGFLSGVSSC